jgi:hypothetical protein
VAAALLLSIRSLQPADVNDIYAGACLADVLHRIADHPTRRIDELLPGSWKPAGWSEAPVEAIRHAICWSPYYCAPIGGDLSEDVLDLAPIDSSAQQ